MSELTDAEKRERRRQKRQQRILNSGEDRLSKITGTAFPHRATPSPTPSPSTSSLKATHAAVAPTAATSKPQRRSSHSDDPSDELGAPAPLAHNSSFNNASNTDPMAALLQQQMASMFGGASGGSSGPGNLDRDPLEQLFASSANNSNTGFNPANMLAQMMMNGGANGATGNSNITAEELQQQQQKIDSSLKYWNLLHLFMMTLLGLFAVYSEWTFAGASKYATLLTQPYTLDHSLSRHMPLFWYFVTIELGLQTVRLLYQKGTLPPTSTIATLATQLPPPLSSLITIILRYKLIWSTFVQDICILVFIIGISQVISNAL